MTPHGKSKQSIWSLLIFVLFLLVGISILKNRKHAPVEEKFELPTLIAPCAEEQPRYQDEIIDPEASTGPRQHDNGKEGRQIGE